MKFEIKPHEGVNDVRFGMTQKEVEEKMPGGEYKAVRNTSPDYLTYIYWQGVEAGFFYFGSTGLLEEIEFSRDMSVILLGKEISKMNVSTMRKTIEDLGLQMVSDKDGFTVKDLGVEVWIQDKEDDLLGSILIRA